MDEPRCTILPGQLSTCMCTYRDGCHVLEALDADDYDPDYDHNLCQPGEPERPIATVELPGVSR